jgi:hypothetical protein
MSEIDQHHLAASRRPYLYPALSPGFCFVEWLLILVLTAHLSESALYRALDISLYFAVVGAVVLVAIPIRFRRSPSLVELVTMSLFCGVVLAFVTFSDT